jgi:hypothetical protein
MHVKLQADATATPRIQAYIQYSTAPTASHAERDAYLFTFVADYNHPRLRCLSYQAPAEALANLTGHNTKAGRNIAPSAEWAALSAPLLL